jgi:hypothetical protein
MDVLDIYGAQPGKLFPTIPYHILYWKYRYGMYDEN